MGRGNDTKVIMTHSCTCSLQCSCKFKVCNSGWQEMNLGKRRAQKPGFSRLWTLRLYLLRRGGEVTSGKHLRFSHPWRKYPRICSGRFPFSTPSVVSKHAQSQHLYFAWKGIKTNKNCKGDLLKDLLEQWSAFMKLEGQVLGLEGQWSWPTHQGAMLSPDLVIKPCVENLVFAHIKGPLILDLYLLAFFCKPYYYPI